MEAEFSKDDITPLQKAITPFAAKSYPKVGCTMDNQVFIKRVWMPDGSIVSANLVYRDRPTLILESGEEVVDNKSEITYEMTHELIVDKHTQPVLSPIKKQKQVYLTPQLIIERQYSIDEKEDSQDIYPPSSNGWLGRFLRGKDNATFIIQKIVDSDQLWLTIANNALNSIYEFHTINKYEFDMLRMKTSYDYFFEAAAAQMISNPGKVKEEILAILDEPELTWSEIHQLTGGLVSPTIQRGNTIRETLHQLVSISKYPVEKQEEILAFLAWVGKGKMPKGDISRFVSSLRIVPTFRDLMAEHLKFRLDNLDPPAYAKIVNEIVDEPKNTGNEFLEERIRKNPDALLSYKLSSLAPDWQGEIVNLAKSLNEAGEIITSLPPSKIATGESHSSQRKRFLISEWGLRLRGHPKPRSLGLRELVYIGAAHRWPHLHLASSLRLGPINTSAPYLQTMIMPSSATEQVKRFLESVIDIQLDIQMLNYTLYNQKKRIWITRTKNIIESLSKSIKLKKFEQEFGNWKGHQPYQLTMEEARIIDMTSLRFYLTDLESEAGQQYWKTNPKDAKSILLRLRKQGVLDISYWFQFLQVLPPITIIIHGKQSQVCSLTSALVKQCPTARAMIAEGGQSSVITCRVPEDSLNFFIDTLPQIAYDNGISVRCIKPTAFRNYTTDLYQRLLERDGKWNNDISGFLSQIRSIPKSSIESIEDSQ